MGCTSCLMEQGNDVKLTVADAQGAGQGGRAGGAAAAGAGLRRKVVVVPLCFERKFSTGGNAAYIYFLIGPKMLEGWGPYVEDIVVHARGPDRTTNFSWGVRGRQTIDGNGWTNFSGMFQDNVTSDGQVISAPYTTRSDLGLHLNFAAAVKISSGAADESGVLTAYAAVKFWT